MRASAVPELSDPALLAGGHRLPRPVVWLLWLLAALAGSVVLGFLAGLARPREPDPWASVPAPTAPTDAAEPTAGQKASPSTAATPAAEDD